MPRVGYWISEKKRLKLNFEENRPLFRNAGIELIRLDLSKPLEEQGPLDAVVHKPTDILAKADSGDLTAQHYVNNLQSYADRHPECVMLDPLEGTRCLLDRYRQYQLVCSCPMVNRDNRIIVPKFVELRTSNVEQNKIKLAEAGVTFPLVVKPILSHGSQLAHEMAIIFNEECLHDVEAPCVAQSFLNHNALLYKIFIVGNRQFVVERPSLKNLYPGNHATIFFDTQEVSKPGSSHPLNEIDVGSIEEPLVKPDWSLLEQLGAAISHTVGMSLIGIDVIIDCCTQQYAIIDINSFPGFEGVDDFFAHLRDHILECLRSRPHYNRAPTTNSNTTSTTTNTSAASATTSATTILPQRFTPSPCQTTTVNFAKDGTVDRATVVTNAANLKASQQPFVLNPSHMIDCRAVVTTSNDGDSSQTCGSRVGKSEGRVGEDEGGSGKDWFLRSNNNNCDANFLPP